MGGVEFLAITVDSDIPSQNVSEISGGVVQVNKSEREIITLWFSQNAMICNSIFLNERL